MEKIILSRGLVSTVDDEDYDIFNKIKWCAVKNRNNWYAINGSGKNKIWLHRIILKCPKGMYVDHKDGNSLNNMRLNLRVSSASQNSANRNPWKNKSSKYLGVYVCRGGKFSVQSRKDGKLYYGGEFKTQEEAAIAYNNLATKLHGDFARLNIII